MAIGRHRSRLRLRRRGPPSIRRALSSPQNWRRSRSTESSSRNKANPDDEIVWSWAASDHLDEFGFATEELKLIEPSKNADYLARQGPIPIKVGARFTARADAVFSALNFSRNS
jgi:hypothetical protein